MSPGAKTEKLETLPRAWILGACRVSSASDRLVNPTRVSNVSCELECFAIGEPAISFTERQPALIAGDTYHLREEPRIDRHSGLVTDFSSDLEDPRAH